MRTSMNHACMLFHLNGIQIGFQRLSCRYILGGGEKEGKGMPCPLQPELAS